MDKFENKVVIVTGASSGIGEATAKEFAKHGASLVLTGRNVENLNAVAEDCKVKGAKDVMTVLADFEKMEEVKNVIEKTIGKFGKLDVLVNNAGTIKGGYLADVKMDDFDWMFQVNVKSVVYLTQLAMPHLVKAKGNVVNVSSLSGTNQFPASLVYGMTKASLDQFTKTIALEYASKGVRVNSVNPAVVRTNIRRSKGWNAEQIDEFYAKCDPLHPLGRNGTVEEVANAIIFLASDASSWTTGQCLVVDGGRALTVTQFSPES